MEFRFFAGNCTLKIEKPKKAIISIAKSSISFMLFTDACEPFVMSSTKLTTNYVQLSKENVRKRVCIHKKEASHRTQHSRITFWTRKTSTLDNKHFIEFIFGSDETVKMSVRVINDESHFQAELTAAGIRLVVVDFTATW